MFKRHLHFMFPDSVFNLVILMFLSFTLLLAVTPDVNQFLIPPIDLDFRANLFERPLIFAENIGQTNPAVLYQAQSTNGSVFFMSDKVVLSLPFNSQIPQSRIFDTQPLNRNTRVTLEFDGSSADVDLIGTKETPGAINYFIGNDPNRWLNNLSLYTEVVYRELYPGIDLYYEGSTIGNLKGTYIVSANVDPTIIRWKYSDIQSVQIDNKNGDLLISLPNKFNDNPLVLVEEKPIASQTILGKEVAVAVDYKMFDDGSVGFVFGEYNSALPLVIDPTLSYSNVLGGSSSDEAYDVAVDASGNFYIVGSTASLDFPTTPNAYAPDFHGTSFYDAFVTKLNPNGELIYSSYLGGLDGIGGFDGSDRAYGVDVDDDGNAYVIGWTSSNDFPVTANAFQPNRQGSSDAFVTKLSPDGSSLIFSTYLGGSIGGGIIIGDPVGEDWGEDIVLDIEGNIYVVGRTFSTDFPTTVGVFQPNHAGGDREDGFVAKIEGDGSELLWASYLGGSGKESLLDGFSVATDNQVNVYISGTTDSTDFPTVNPIQSNFGGFFDAFLAKVNPDGSSLIYATYLGGDSEERSQGVDVDAFGNAHVVGVTLSTDFPIANAFQPLRNGADRNLFITKFNSDGTEFIYSTYFGGTSADAYEDSDIAVDSCGKAFVIMETSSIDLLSINEIQPGFAGGGYDAFVANLNASGTQLLHSTYLGGSETDYGYGISLDAVGNIYVAGATNSPDFPTANAQPVFGSGFDAFVSKIDFDSTRVTPDTGGNTGYVSISLYGCGFESGSSVSLKRVGQADITADSVIASEFGDTLTAIFNLSGKQIGLYDVEITSPSGGKITLSQSFEIEPGVAPDVWVELIGSETIRPGRENLFWIRIGNSGNVDLLEEQIIVISWPTNADLEIVNAISAYGQPLPQPVVDGDRQGIGVFIPRLQANESTLIPFVLSTSSIGANLTLSAAAVSASSFPYTSPSVSSQFNLGTTTAFSNSPSGEEALPDGAIVFMGPHDSNPFGHEAIVENIGGEAYVWDHWLATVAENIEQPIPLSRPGPNNDWQDVVGGSYLGGAVSSSWTEQNRKDAVEAAKEIIQNNKNIDWVFDWGAKSDEAGYTCTSFIEHVYELAGVDIITSSSVDPLFLFPSVHHRILTGELDFYAANTYSLSYLIAWPITPMEYLVHAGLLNVLQSALFGTFIEVQVVGSLDPNEKLGPIGSGDARFIQNDQEMTYVIKFENVESATAPAQEIVITDQLDTSVIDISTLKLLDVSFGSKTVTPSEATADLFSVVDLRPEQELIVNIETSLNTETGLLTWYFTSIDPATGELPTDALTGFLPPNTNPPEGEGFVMFTVQLKPDLPQGTKIENEAKIIFDTNEPIQTNTWVNTIPIYTYLPTVLR